MFGKKRSAKKVNGTTIQIGMPLVDVKYNYIGKVKEIKRAGFIVDRSAMHFPDLFIRYNVCIHNGAQQLQLETTVKELEQQEARASA